MNSQQYQRLVLDAHAHRAETPNRILLLGTVTFSLVLSAAMIGTDTYSLNTTSPYLETGSGKFSLFCRVGIILLTLVNAIRLLLETIQVHNNMRVSRRASRQLARVAAMRQRQQAAQRFAIQPNEGVVSTGFHTQAPNVTLTIGPTALDGRPLGPFPQPASSNHTTAAPVNPTTAASTANPVAPATKPTQPTLDDEWDGTDSDESADESTLPDTKTTKASVEDANEETQQPDDEPVDLATKKSL